MEFFLFTCKVAAWCQCDFWSTHSPWYVCIYRLKCFSVPSLYTEYYHTLWYQHLTMAIHLNLQARVRHYLMIPPFCLSFTVKSLQIPTNTYLCVWSQNGICVRHSQCYGHHILDQGDTAIIPLFLSTTCQKCWSKLSCTYGVLRPESA